MTCRSTSSPSPPNCPGCTRRRCASTSDAAWSHRAAAAAAAGVTRCGTILALREIQRLSQEEGVNLSGIKLILSQLRELEQARRLVAELHAEVAQLRVELESTRAVAARLAELRRSGSDSDPGLVPVRRARVAIWEPMTGPSGGTGQPRGDK